MKSGIEKNQEFIRSKKQMCIFHKLTILSKMQVLEDFLFWDQKWMRE